MTPDDFRALTDWLYDAGEPALGMEHADMRVDRRSVRAWRSGRTPVPATIAAYVIGRVALRLTLKGWGPEPLIVSEECVELIRARQEEALRHAQRD